MNKNTFHRNELLAETVIKGLESRNMTGHYAESREAALALALSLIGEGSSVTMGGCTSAIEIGLVDALKNGNYRFIDRDAYEDKRAAMLAAYDADVFLTSANAMSSDGVIVNIDGNGNRVAAITWGPKKVIFVVGLNKVAPTVEAALARARSTASPINAQRFDIQTPCRTDGVCHNCNSPESICSYVHFLRNSRNKGRHVVVLVGEDLGY